MDVYIHYKPKFIKLVYKLYEEYPFMFSTINILFSSLFISLVTYNFFILLFLTIMILISSLIIHYLLYVDFYYTKNNPILCWIIFAICLFIVIFAIYKFYSVLMDISHLLNPSSPISSPKPGPGQPGGSGGQPGGPGGQPKGPGGPIKPKPSGTSGSNEDENWWEKEKEPKPKPKPKYAMNANAIRCRKQYSRLTPEQKKAKAKREYARSKNKQPIIELDIGPLLNNYNGYFNNNNKS